jgi:hypothetical protein
MFRMDQENGFPGVEIKNAAFYPANYLVLDCGSIM